jgi:hypothetical protein
MDVANTTTLSETSVVWKNLNKPEVILMFGPQNEYLEPWIPEISKTFLEELQNEISENHILNGIDLIVTARRLDKDEVLFQLQEDPNKYVHVHLTWRGDKELNTNWPISRVFNSFEEWAKEVMLLDNKEYEEE